MNSRKDNSLTLRCSVFYLTRHVCKRSRAYPHGNPSFAHLWFCFCIFHVIIQQCNIFWIVLWFVVVVHFLPFFIWDFSLRGGFTLYHPPSCFLLLLFYFSFDCIITYTYMHTIAISCTHIFIYFWTKISDWLWKKSWKIESPSRVFFFSLFRLLLFLINATNLLLCNTNVVVFVV